MMASLLGHLAVVKPLLDKGADANAKSKDGATALMMAIEEGHVDVVDMLRRQLSKRRK